MVTVKKLKKTVEEAADFDYCWVTLSSVNKMLEEMGVKARFTTQQQNYYNEDGKDGEILKLTVYFHEEMEK